MPKHAANDTRRLCAKTPYQQGLQEARDEARQQLADILRIQASGQAPDGEKITGETARAIFASMFGVYECDKEFGPEPGISARNAA